MFDYHTCIVPDIKFRRCDLYVWVAYEKKPPYLPVEIAKTAEELARKCGVSYGTVVSTFWKYQKGKIKRSRYHKVKVGYSPALEGDDG